MAPLALRLRPKTLEEFVGQRHVLGEGSALRLAIAEDRVGSTILYGPPGSGKTTLARIVAGATGAEFEDLYQLAEALTEWDERVTVWRFRHYKVVSRIIGDSVVGTQGTPVELLGSLIKKNLYPELWRARNDITARSNEED